jgi:hypothetical protein
MRPIPSVTTAEYIPIRRVTAEYILTPNAVIRRVQHGTQPAVWGLHFFGDEAIASFSEHPAGGPALGVGADELAAEVARDLAGDSGGDYRQTARDAVDALIRFAQDMAEDVEAVDLARENAVIRTIMQAQRIGAGWTGNEVDVAHLHRALRRTGVVP